MQSSSHPGVMAETLKRYKNCRRLMYRWDNRPKAVSATTIHTLDI